MKKVVIGIVIFMVVILVSVLSINIYVKNSTKKQIISVNDAMKLDDVDCIIVLGAGLYKGNPTPMLKDRLEQGIELYNNEVSFKILMSGDHGRVQYDEVNTMKKYATSAGVPSSDVFMDHAGFSTYESIYRAKEIFESKKVVIVTQRYHLYRALYIANKLGLEAYGVVSDPRTYSGQSYREFREILARNKDFFQCILKLKPTYLGDKIPISGDGDVTNDENS